MLLSSLQTVAPKRTATTRTHLSHRRAGQAAPLSSAATRRTPAKTGAASPVCVSTSCSRSRLLSCYGMASPRAATTWADGLSGPAACAAACSWGRSFSLSSRRSHRAPTGTFGESFILTLRQEAATPSTLAPSSQVAPNEHVPNMWQYPLYFNCTLLAAMLVVRAVSCYKMFHPVEMSGHAKATPTPTSTSKCIIALNPAVLALTLTLTLTGLGRQEMTPEEAYECLETGDLVFTSSTSIGALCIKYFTVCAFPQAVALRVSMPLEAVSFVGRPPTGPILE